MNITLLLAHPRPESFNHALAHRVSQTLSRSGHTLTHHDLYKEGFDPVLTASECLTTSEATDTSLVQQALLGTDDSTVIAHRAEIAAADGLVVIHPNWWGKPPAILSGWIDRVLVPGVAYHHDQALGQSQPMLGLQAALVITTADTPVEEQLKMGDPLESIWMNSVLPYCGSPAAQRLDLAPVAGSTQGQRSDWLDEVEALATQLFS